MFALLLVVTAIPLTLISYIIYERYFHPLARFPGPFWATITDFWRFYHELIGDGPELIHKYHQKYGPVLRVAPNELNFSSADVVEAVYKKGGREYPKSEFFDGFTAIKPNVFGTRDEDLHAMRRRQMSHGFSQASFVRMEYIFDKHVRKLMKKLATYADSVKICDLKIILRCYGHDVNCELSLGQDFRTLEAEDLYTAVPPLNSHISLSKLLGYVPWIKPYFVRYGMSLPSPYLRHLLTSRGSLKRQAEEVTAREFTRLREKNDKQLLQDEEASENLGHDNLLTELVKAKDPETGELIAQDEIASNALAFLVAGSHSTAASLGFLFWHLLHNPSIMTKAFAEIDDAYSDFPEADIPPYSGMETKLPYLSAVVKESFRLTPSVQHPLPRVTPSNPASSRFPSIIAGKTIPPGTPVSASILALHLNPDIWGPDAESFVPDRWFNDDIRQKERYLMHFGAGHRMCIGKNQALIMLWKAAVEALRRFNFSLPNPDDVNENLMTSARGFAELASPLDTRVTLRKPQDKLQ